METDQSRILLVEGTGDKNVITDILKVWGVPRPYINVCDGVERVFTTLSLCLSNPGHYKTVGVIVDADVHPEGRLQRFAQIAKKTDRYSLKECAHLQAEGLVLTGLDPDAARLGLWVMPDNQGHGMLEDFLANLAATVNPELLDESERAIANVEKRGIQQYAAIHRPKAKMHTYLAWQKEPGVTLSTAIMKNYLDAKSDNARLFVEWVKRLYWQ